MSIYERKEKNKNNIRQSILKVAEELFIQHGFQNVSMRKIAQKIEYSPTTIYLYFKDKNDIFNCLLEEYFAKLFSIQQKILDEDENPLVCIRRGMLAYIEFGLANPNYYKLAFLANPQFAAGDYLGSQKKGTCLYHCLRNNVERCIQQGYFKSKDVDLATQIVWSMNHGLTSLLITNPNFPWRERNYLIGETIDSIIRGLEI